MIVLKVLVGLSGGVDSAIAAYLLKEAGHDVSCAFMRNWDSLTNNDILGNPSIADDQCSQELDYEDALAVAKHLGLELLRVDYIKEYWNDVFSRFLAETKLGFTPNPDILCNRYVKFDAFFKYMDDLGFDYLATGHYARIKEGKLYRAKDESKDQSYFLSRVRPEVLERVLFPLGDMTKKEVRKLADELDLPVARKKDSTGICFIGERHYQDFLKNYIKGSEGDIVDIDTQAVIGKHQGVMFYTIGQRHGLDISGVMGPWFVVGKDMSKRIIYVGKGAEHPKLYASRAVIDHVNWFSEDKTSRSLAAKFRYRQKDQRVHITFNDDGTLAVAMLDPVKAVTLGQEAVFYDAELCLGGGRIAKVFDNEGNEVSYDTQSQS